MEEGARNGGFSGGVIKNRNSTGCLIIKKKVDGVSSGGGYSGPDIVYKRKEKKRPRPVESDSGPSDDELLEFYKRRAGPNQVSASSSSVLYKDGILKEGEFGRKKRANFARNEVFLEERKRNTLDVYDFDEYDDLDDMDNGHFSTQSSGRIFVGMKPLMRSGGRREFETGSSRHAMMNDRKRLFLESPSSEKMRGSTSSLDGRFSKLPIPALKEKFESRSDEAIRLQGKNGVLKLMVKNKKVGGLSTAPNYKEAEGSNRSRSGELTPKKIMRRSTYLEKKVLSEPNKVDRKQMDKIKPRKSMPSESSEDTDEQSEESEEPPRIPSSDMRTRRPPKRGASETVVTPSPERVQTSRLKESNIELGSGTESRANRGGGTDIKVKRGSGTEKQRLREKIRNMLVTAGWTIDYRPRRNRDYFDAVYINPAGTAYWSIIKAYDALQKQLEEEGANPGGECSETGLISDHTLRILTRQTQKKLEKELKRKKKEDLGTKRKKKAATGKFVNHDPETDSTGSGSEEEKLSSFIKQSVISKGRLHETPNGDGSQPAKMQGSIEKPSSSSSHVIHGRKTKKIGRCTLLVRNADKGLNSEGDGFVPYKGKRTVLSWLIDSGTVKLSEKVLYMNRRRTRVMLEGWITRDGIHCGCCSKILTVSKFEIHAASKLRQPYQNICLPSGVSLLECQVDAWNTQDDSHRRGFHTIDVDGDDPDDDTCGICGDGGNLICCDGCPSTFHQNCLGIEMLPPGDWHCPHCSCKFCGLADVDASQRKESTSNKLPECSLCERKYHRSCIPEMNSDSNSSSNQISFCGRQCQELFERLQKLLGAKHELESGLSWSLIHRTDIDTDPSHRGFSQKVEWNAKLAVALTIMDECFLPIIDRRSGINLIQNVLYNCRSNFNRLNYGGFYTAILERGDEIICAASIRIHGPQLAEMPFIGTRHIYRRQGMMRRLLCAIESALRSLKVEKLIIPAISDMMHTWTTVFSFSALEEPHKQEMKSLNMLVFPGTDMLQKKLVEHGTSMRDLPASKGTDFCKDGGSCSPLPGMTKRSDMESSPSEASAGDPLPHNDPLVEKSGAPQNDLIVEKSDAGLSLHDSSVPLNASSFPGSSLDVSSAQAPPLCKMKTEGSSSELDDELVNSALNDMDPRNPSTIEVAKTDILGNKVNSAYLKLEVVDGSVVGTRDASMLVDGSQENRRGPFANQTVSSDSTFAKMPESASDVKKPSTLDARHDTPSTGESILESPTKNDVQAAKVEIDAPSEINERSAEIDSAVEARAIHPHLKSELDAALVIYAKTSDPDSTSEASGASTPATLLCSDGTDDAKLQTEEVQPDYSALDNAKHHVAGETCAALEAKATDVNSLLEARVISSNGTSTSVSCSEVTHEPDPLALVQAVDYSQMEQQLGAPVSDMKPRLLSSVDHAILNIQAPQSGSSIEGKKSNPVENEGKKLDPVENGGDSLHENNVEVAGTGVGRHSPAKASNQVSEC